MPPMNYRQARRNREDARKARQKQKLERKSNRDAPATATAPATDDVAPAPAGQAGQEDAT